MNTIRLSIATPLGRLWLTVHDECAVSALAKFAPSLPVGMSVSGCYALVVAFNAENRARDRRLSVTLEPTGTIDGGPETGEGIEAIAWRGRDHILVVGTEDDESLRSRLQTTEPVATFSYSHTALEIVISPLQATRTVNSHLVAAWNPLPEPVAESCWYAVDQMHATVTAQIAA